MDEPGHHVAVLGNEIKVADMANRSVSSDAGFSGVRVTFVSIDQDLLHTALAVGRTFSYFLGWSDLPYAFLRFIL